MYVYVKKATMYGNKAILGHLPHCCQWNELPTVALMYGGGISAPVWYRPVHLQVASTMVASFMINTIFISVLAHLLLILWHGIQYSWFCISSFFRSNTLVANWLCLLLEIYWLFAGQLPGSSLPSIGGMFPNMLPFGVAGQVIPFFIFINSLLFFVWFFAWTGLFAAL